MRYKGNWKNKLNIKNYILICTDELKISLRLLHDIFELIQNWNLYDLKRWNWFEVKLLQSSNSIIIKMKWNRLYYDIFKFDMREICKISRVSQLQDIHTMSYAENLKEGGSICIILWKIKTRKTNNWCNKYKDPVYFVKKDYMSINKK